MKFITKATKYHGGRSLLNREGYYECASIVAEIEDTSDWEKLCDNDEEKFTKHTSAYSLTPSIKFAISDCDRTIRFEFDFDIENAYDNNLYKVQQMITILTKFKQGLIIEHERFDARVQELEAYQGGLKEQK